MTVQRSLWTWSSVGLFLAVALCSPAHAQPVAEKSALEVAARSAFEAGREDYEHGEFARALAHFERAYALSPPPQLLFNIGRAAESSRSGTYVVLGPVHSPVLTLRFAQPPAIDTRAHVRIVLDRIDDERSSATIRYGDETLRVSSLSMPLRESSGPAAYDVTLGLFDSQQQRSVGAPGASARYDNYVNRTTYPP